VADPHATAWCPDHRQLGLIVARLVAAHPPGAPGRKQYATLECGHRVTIIGPVHEVTATELEA
jgi:hypothetical protein